MPRFVEFVSSGDRKVLVNIDWVCRVSPAFDGGTYIDFGTKVSRLWVATDYRRTVQRIMEGPFR